MHRIDVSVPTDDGALAAWLYRPSTDTNDPSPCIVLAHGFTGVRDMQLAPAAERFAQAGLAALVFDYRHFGDSDGRPRQLLDLRRQYADWDAAVAYAQELEGVDPQRIVLWGTSFSGGHVLDAAVRHPDIAAAILQAPFVDGIDQMIRTKKSMIPRLIVDAWRDQIRSWTRRPPHYVPVTCQSGGYAVLASPHVWDSVPVIVPEGSTWRNEVAARLMLRLGMHRPVRHAKRVSCPLLVQVLTDETVLGVRPAMKVAQLAPHGEMRFYEGLDHFDIYVGDGFERLNADQNDFLDRHVLRSAALER
jgi:dienelactone hydrolase